MELFSFLRLIQRESIRVGQLLHRAGLTQYAQACQHIEREILFGERSLIEGIQERAQESSWAAVARAADEQVKSQPS